MKPSGGIETINPLSHISEEHYSAIWQKIFSTVLAGFWCRFFFFVCIVLALFFGIRKRNPQAALVFALLATLIAYGAGVLGFLKTLKIY